MVMVVTPLAYLHSTMYLLNPEPLTIKEVGLLFTFHYVSIKSGCGLHT